MLSQRLKLAKKTGNSHYSLWVLNSIIYHYISRLGRQWLISLYFSFGSLVAYKILKIFKTPRFQAQCKAGPGSPPHFCITPCLRVLNPIPIASLSLSLSLHIGSWITQSSQSENCASLTFRKVLTCLEFEKLFQKKHRRPFTS